MPLQAGGPGTRTSSEALQLRAVALFNRSLELMTGRLAWTRGELLGEGSYGRVRRSSLVLRLSYAVFACCGLIQGRDQAAV